MKNFSKAALTAFALILSACAGPAKPVNLYRLTPLPTTSETPNASPIVIAVERPQSPAALETPRIALTRCAIDFDYFAGPEWIDDVPDLFQRLVIESLDGQQDILATDASHGTLPADQRLRLDVRLFQAEYCKDQEAPTAHIRLSVKRLNPKTMKIESATTLDAMVPAEANTQKAIVAAFNAAMQQVLGNLRIFITQ